MKRLLVAIFFVLSMAASAQQQAPSKEPATAVEAEAEETVEGLWSVLGYFGGKLTSELGSRLNLTNNEDQQNQGVPTKVKLKLGSLEFVRTDNRRSASR